MKHHQAFVTSKRPPLVVKFNPYLCILSVASLVRSPPVPIIKPLAVFLLFTISSSLTITEDEPLAKVTRTSGVWLVTFTIVCQGVPGQTPALSLQRVHGPHEAGGAQVHGAVLHDLARSRGVQLVTGSVLGVEDVTFLTLALRSHCGVVEGEDVTNRTRAS